MKPNQIPTSDRDAYFTLSHLCEPADVAVSRALAESSPQRVIERLIVGDLKKKSHPLIADRFGNFSLEKEIDFCQSINAKFITRGEIGWPRQLSDLDESEPWTIWSLGSADFRIACLQSVAIVGTRDMSPYGRGIAYEWAGQIAESGATVVSGGAIGIDISAHRGALSVQRPTVCVMAGGVQARYPVSNEHIFSAIMDSGILVSESPPRESPRRQRFLTRNRLIAALTQATLVVEASRRSGSASTAGHAHALGRAVLGVPGSVFSAQSEGIHNLISSGTATLVTRVEDVLRHLSIGVVDEKEPGVTPGEWRNLAQRELDVWEAIPRRGGLSIEEIATQAQWRVPEVIASLTELTLKGMVFNDGMHWKRG
jgi:DNA processing protein